MATVSPIARSLVDQVHIHYGFWISHGATAFPPGLAVTVTTPVYAFLTAGLTLFATWVAARTWRIINFLIFRSIYERTKTSLEESQCAALVVNDPVPISVLVTAGKLAYRGGPKNTLFKIIIASLFGVLLQGIVPLSVFFFPPHNGGLIVPTHCGYDSAIAGTSLKYVGKPKRFGNAALSFIDRNASAVDGVKKANLLKSLPNISQFQSYITECPSGVSCHSNHLFTFSSRYNLTSRHFGLNIHIPFTIYVNETCYRPIDAFEPIPGTNQYGLDYGRVRIGEETDPYTSRFRLVQSYAPGDTLISYWALTDNAAGYNAWTPHSTLGLGGDTTILMYFIGYISLLEKSNDPIFATNTRPTDPTALTIGTLVCSWSLSLLLLRACAAYWVMIILLAAATACVLHFPQFHQHQRRRFRATIFVSLGPSSLFPIIHAVILFGLKQTQTIWLVLVPPRGAVMCAWSYGLCNTDTQTLETWCLRYLGELTPDLPRICPSWLNYASRRLARWVQLKSYTRGPNFRTRTGLRDSPSGIFKFFFSIVDSGGS